MATIWQKPEFTELSMNAEVGSYQEDFDDREHAPVIETTKEDASAASEPGA